MNKTKICIMTSVHPAKDVRIYYKEARSLAKEGYDVTLLNSYINQTDDLGIKLVKVDIPKKRFKRVLFSSKKMYRAALEQQADIYHFHDPELYSAGLKLLKKALVIYDVHEDVPMQILDKPYLNKYVRKIWSKIFGVLEKRAARKYTAVICAESPVEEIFIKSGCKKTVTVSNYPILSEFSFEDIGWEQRKNCIGYVGSISKLRGICELTDCLRFTGSSLILAGNFNSGILKEQIMQKDTWEKVDFRGFVGREEISDILKTIKAGMVTLYPIKNYINSFPVKMFEYMAAGVPVICSDFPFWRELLHGIDCAVFVDPYNPKEIAEKVDFLLNDSSTAQRMGKEGQKAVLNKFNWDNECKKLLALYRELSM